jgi:hypothetical protein|tara:strand:- start:8441 stop:8632 length:192 start_codon:yes stop_codon:yes gene_type:complete
VTIYQKLIHDLTPIDLDPQRVAALVVARHGPIEEIRARDFDRLLNQAIAAARQEDADGTTPRS